MSRKISIKAYNQGQTVLFPESMDTYIKPDAPVLLINAIADQLDLTQVLDSYSGGGCSCYSPRMLLKVLFYGYPNNVYSCRKISRAMEENIHYMWLSGRQFPKYNTVNSFRSRHLKDAVNNLFTQAVVMLIGMGHVTLKEQYMDGTKLESRASKYTFVWKKPAEKHKTKLEAKIRFILQETETGIASDNTPDDDPPTPVHSEELREWTARINRENRSRKEQKQLDVPTGKFIPKLEEYGHRLAVCGERNSYSKTDTDATFMRMKEDAMKNGQTKPGYNLQTATENQFITNFDFYSTPTDTLTLIPFLNLHQTRYNRMPQVAVAGAGYGSEENHAFMESQEIESYVKYNYFHKERKRSYENSAFLVDNLYYNRQADYSVCPMGQHMTLAGKHSRRPASGYLSQIHVCQAQRCTGCPLHGLCHKSKENRCIEVNHNLRAYKKKARELLTSQEGLRHRSQRPVEPETVFGQMKANKQYKRFRHFGKDKIYMDFAVFAISFNLGKIWNIGLKQEKRGEEQYKNQIILHTVLLITLNSITTRKTNEQILYFHAIAA